MGVLLVAGKYAVSGVYLRHGITLPSLVKGVVESRSYSFVRFLISKEKSKSFVIQKK